MYIYMDIYIYIYIHNILLAYIRLIRAKTKYQNK